MQNKNKKYACFSIDVERFIDTECVRNTNQPVEETMLDGLDRYMEILDKHNIKATMFVLSDFADEIREQLKKHLENGHRIALHGKEHIAPRLHTNDTFKSQTEYAKEKLEKLFDTRIDGYRAPHFSIDREKLNILSELGFRYDSSRMDFPAARYTTYVDMTGFDNPVGEIYKKDNFFEFGVSTEKVFGKNYPVSGGGYIRVSNWLFTSALLKRHIKKNDYYMFYLHPFELSRKKKPKLKRLKFYDRMYLSLGNITYKYKIEYIIKQLKKFGYTFTTFEKITET